MKFATGSITGSYHHKSLKNNQDSFFFKEMNSDSAKITIGIASDGCGSGPHSEMGSILGSSLLGSYLTKEIAWYWGGADLTLLIRKARAKLIKAMRYLNSDNSEYKNDHLLFTIIGFVAIGEDLVIFHEGDGFYMVNDNKVLIDQKNQPTYMVYNIDIPVHDMEFHKYKISDVNRLMIATDGIQYLQEKEDKLGFIEQFFEPQYYNNPMTLQRKLMMMNEPKIRLKGDEIEKTGYNLYDDLTVICGVKNENVS